jgi:hypothetical protein
MPPGGYSTGLAEPEARSVQESCFSPGPELGLGPSAAIILAEGLKVEAAHRKS